MKADMYIQPFTPIFTGRNTRRIKPLIAKSHLPSLSDGDTFVRPTFDVGQDMKFVKLGPKINSGRTKDVYKSNFPTVVVGLNHGEVFNLNEVKVFNDPNGIVLAKNNTGTIRLMKYIEGTPLYGPGWNIYQPVSKDEYMRTFHKISALPDGTFAEFIRNFVKIKENGYDIDTINPNNFLLNGRHIGIVDIEKAKKVCDIPYQLKISDFDALINKHDIKYILREMNYSEIDKFADEIKTFYDRMIKIAKKEGYELSVPATRKFGPNNMQSGIYLYYKDWGLLERLIGKANRSRLV